MNVAQFIKKYAASALKEEAVTQQHSLDLCILLQHLWQQELYKLASKKAEL